VSQRCETSAVRGRFSTPFVIAERSATLAPSQVALLASRRPAPRIEAFAA
jgi:hypothetical protein